MKFEWDANKEKQNIKKHDISFSVALSVFFDLYRLEWLDKRNSIFEDRFITIGYAIKANKILYVVYCVRDEYIRIISARNANKVERRNYYDSKTRI